VLQHPLMLAVVRHSQAPDVWHNICRTSGMKQLRRGSVMSSRLLRRKGFTDAGQWERVVSVTEGHYGSGPAEDWSLSSHSPGQEPWSLKFEELVRLRREAGDADGIDGELIT
jgi:hypothetical protein